MTPDVKEPTAVGALVEKAAGLLRRAKKVVALTGAGISTESGIPDFRSPGGVWSKYRMVTLQEFLSSHEDRVEYWKRKKETYPAMASARPNPAHFALTEIEKIKDFTLITQNIDGLHQKAGSKNVLELHGNEMWVECLSCGKRTEREAIQKRLRAGEEVPLCVCGGFLKPATISFGQALPEEILSRASSAAENCDLFLAIGSSLSVQPANMLPALAKKSGAALVIVNLGETEMDALADIKIDAKVSLVLPEIVRRACPDPSPHLSFGHPLPQGEREGRGVKTTGARFLQDSRAKVRRKNRGGAG